MEKPIRAGAFFLLALASTGSNAKRPEPPPPPPPVTIEHPALPRGASIIGTSTFATVLNAPPNPRVTAARRLPPPPVDDGRSWYAREHGLSEAEAKRRQSEQGRLALTYGHIVNRLRSEQPDNFVGAMIRHEPDWAYVFFFKRDPAGTLGRYLKHPRFEAKLAKYNEADRQQLIAPWSKRWSAEGIPFAFGLDAVYPTMNVSLGIRAEEYRALAAARGWGDPPEPIVLKFMRSPVSPRVDPRIASLLRGFANEKFATIVQLEALGTGKLVLRDGCLKVKWRDGSERVAVFHYETGIGLDDEGYLALIDRMTGKVRGRVGEMMAWGAPNAIPENGMVGLEELRGACRGEILNIGNPESKAAFDARYRRSN